MKQVATWIAEALENRTNPDRLHSIRNQVRELADQFPLYPHLHQPAPELQQV
jgi:glycine hydroxymethyltransferase